MNQASSLDQTMVRIVRYVSECDVEPISPPITYRDAMRELRRVKRSKPRLLDRLDLIDCTEGRFVSWIV